MSGILSGRRQRFCEGVVNGLTAAEAYKKAYPKSSPGAAERNTSRLMKRPEIKAEIQRIRDTGEKLAGSAAMNVAEVHAFLAKVVRGQVALLPGDSPLWQSIKYTKDGVEYRLPDKLGAIARWCDLKGEGCDAKAGDALTGLLERIQK
jgi:hypothetical protein